MRLVAAITPHGFGHAAQAVAVLRALVKRRPGTELHIATRVPRDWLAARLDVPFHYHPHATDFGLVMHSPVQIDHDLSASGYASLYRDRYRLLEEETEWLAGLAPDLVLADAPWLPLAAARRLGIPAAGLCSLNWAGIYRHFYASGADGMAVFEWLRESYNQADCFLRPAPAMPMPELENVRDIGPIAMQVPGRREALVERFGLPGDARLVLVALGGVGGRLPMEHWPRQPKVFYLVEAAWQVAREDAIAIQDTGLAFLDLLASADLVLGKCGYGTVAECAVNATPLLAIRREDGWPEDAPLSAWLQRHGRMAWITRQQAERGEFMEEMETLLESPAPEPPEPSGAPEAAELLLQLGYK